MNDSMGDGLDDLDRDSQSADVPQPRAVGSPLPMGSGGRAQPSQGKGDSKRPPSVPPPGRALANSLSADDPDGQPSSLQRALSALRLALPLVQRILPLLDGNIATAVSNIINPHPQAPPPPPPVNLAPIEDSLTELQTQHRDLRDQVVEQNSSLKRVEDQLEMVREATDRNTLEQQELLEDLKVVGNKVNVVAIIALGLLVIAVVLNLVLYLHIQRVLP